MKIKIAHLVSSLSVNSGVMAVIMNYYRNICRDRVEFHFIFFNEVLKDTYRDEINALGGKCIKLDGVKFTKEYIHAVNDVFANNKYDVLHIHELYLAFLFAPIAKRNGVGTIIGHAHTTKFSDKKINALRNKILCFRVSHMCDYRFACSVDAGKLYFGDSVVKKDKFVLIHNAINTTKYSYNKEIRDKYRQEFKIKEQEIVIGNVGRLELQKNQEFLLKVISVLKKNYDNIKLIIVGEGTLLPKLKILTQTLGIQDNVIFTGRRTDVESIYNAFDIFILPSIFEGLGNVLIEAQCNGLKCICSKNVPCEAKVLESLEYLDLDLGVQSWANYLSQALQNLRRDNDAVKKVKRMGYDITTEANKLLDAYQNMLYINKKQ